MQTETCASAELPRIPTAEQNKKHRIRVSNIGEESKNQGGKKMITKKKAKIMSLILSAAMGIPLLPVVSNGKSVRADGFTKSKENTRLSVTGIGSPKAPESKNDAWTGNYVWFGKYDGNPIKFRVLAPTTDRFSGETGENTLFLDSDMTLYSANYDSDKKMDSWAKSSVRSGLQGNKFLTKSNGLTGPEVAAIAESTIASHDLVVGTEAGNVCSYVKKEFETYVPLDKDTVFLLDAEDVSNLAYGYAIDEVALNRVKNSFDTGKPLRWWLRSIDDVEVGCLVEDNGEFNDLKMSFYGGIAPAMNLKHESVLFSTEIKAPNKSGYNGEYKLTVLDKDLHIEIPVKKQVTFEDRTISVPYHYWGTDASKARVTVLITDKAVQPGNSNNAKILYYSELSGVSGYTGTGTFTLPEDLSIFDWGNKYSVYIFTEKLASGDNALYETDYASLLYFVPDPVLPLDEAHFPDANFREYLKKFDSDQSKDLSTSEIKAVSYIDVNGKGIADLTGIGYFPNLAELRCANNQLTSLDISKNPELRSLNCSGNQLTELDLSQNQKLETLSCAGNQITTLDLRNCPILENCVKTAKRTAVANSQLGQEYFGFGSDYSYRILIDRIVQLILTDSPAATDLPVDETNFPDPNFRKYILESVDLNSTKTLSSSEISAVTEMNCINRSISDMTGLQYFTEITKLYCSQNNISSLNVGVLPKLTLLDCASNKLTELDMTKNTALTFLCCTDNQLTSLKLKNSALTCLACYGNKISVLDIHNCAALLNIVNTTEWSEYKDYNDQVLYYEYFQDWENLIEYDVNTKIRLQDITPGKVTGLSAASAGKNNVKLTWNAVEGAEGYLVYAQKDGKYGYVGMTTKGTTFTDTKALDSDYNYYWVFAYVKDETGKMVAGGCEKYVYAKGVCLAVTDLKASSVTGGVKLTWTASTGAEGYLVYGIHPGGSYGYIGMTTKGTTFTDKNASKTDWNFYWVFPYHKNSSGNMIVGGTPKYVYGKAK